MGAYQYLALIPDVSVGGHHRTLTLSQTDANGVTTTYSYDALNRVASISYPDSSLDVRLTYDGGTNQKGRLTWMSDGTGSTTFSYDVFGSLTQESKTIDGNLHVTAYVYFDGLV